MNTTNFIITSGEERFTGPLRPSDRRNFFDEVERDDDAPDEPGAIFTNRPIPMRGLITDTGRGQGWYQEQRSNNLCADWCEWMDWFSVDFPLWTQEDLDWIDALE